MTLPSYVGRGHYQNWLVSQAGITVLYIVEIIVEIRYYWCFWILVSIRNLEGFLDNYRQTRNSCFSNSCDEKFLNKNVGFTVIWITRNSELVETPNHYMLLNNLNYEAMSQSPKRWCMGSWFFPRIIQAELKSHVGRWLCLYVNLFRIWEVVWNKEAN